MCMCVYPQTVYIYVPYFCIAASVCNKQDGSQLDTLYKSKLYFQGIGLKKGV